MLEQRVRRCRSQRARGERRPNTGTGGARDGASRSLEDEDAPVRPPGHRLRRRGQPANGAACRLHGGAPGVITGRGRWRAHSAVAQQRASQQRRLRCSPRGRRGVVSARLRRTTVAVRGGAACGARVDVRGPHLAARRHSTARPAFARAAACAVARAAGRSGRRARRRGRGGRLRAGLGAAGGRRGRRRRHSTRSRRLGEPARHPRLHVAVRGRTHHASLRLPRLFTARGGVRASLCERCSVRPILPGKLQQR